MAETVLIDRAGLQGGIVDQGDGRPEIEKDRGDGGYGAQLGKVCGSRNGGGEDKRCDRAQEGEPVLEPIPYLFLLREVLIVLRSGVNAADLLLSVGQFLILFGISLKESVIPRIGVL